MIEAFIGKVGGGKSFCSVRRMCAYMASGGRCCSNIMLSGWDSVAGDLAEDSPVRAYLRAIGWNYQPRQYVYISFDDMVASADWYERIPAGQDRLHRTLLVVDEATDLFDNLDRDKVRADSSYRALFRFLRLSRHAHIDVLFVCQDLSAINSRLRNLVGGIWRSIDMQHYRLAGVRIPFPFNVFLLQLFDSSGKFETAREWVRKEEAIYGLYQSEAFGQSVGVKWDGVAVSRDAGKVKGYKDKEVFSMRWKIIALVAVVLSVISVCREVVGFFEMPESHAKESGEQAKTIKILLDKVKILEARTNVAQVVASEVVTSRADARLPSVVRGVFEYHCAGDLAWVFFDGCKLVEGLPCEWGVVSVVSKEYVRVVDGQGRLTWLLPRLDDGGAASQQVNPPRALNFKHAEG